MKKLFATSILAAGLAVLGAQVATAQIDWSDLADATSFSTIAPSGAQMGGSAVVTVGSTDYLYLVGPNTGSDTQNIFYCDVTDIESPGTWQTATFVAPQNNLVYTTNCVFGYNERLYVVAGDWNTTSVEYNGIRVFAPASTGDITAIQQEYDGTAGDPDLTGFASSAVLDESTGIVYILAATGTSSDIIQRVQIDGGTGDITGAPVQCGTLPETLRQAPMVINNGYLYVCGGYNSNTSTATANVYYAEIQAGGDLGTFTATTAAMPQGVADGGAAMLDGKLYIMGGTTANSNATAVDDVIFADLTGGPDVTAWMADVDLPFANGGIRRIGAATTDETIFIIGGRQPDGAINQAIHTGVVYVAPLNSESWETYE